MKLIRPILSIVMLVAAACLFPQAGLASEFLSNSSPLASPHPILSDINVRRAIAYCTDRVSLIQAGYPFLSEVDSQQLLMDSFLPKTHWAYTQPTFTYPYNPSAGEALLEAAGWVKYPGSEYRMKDGKYLAITMTSTTATFRMTYLAELESQLAECGIQIIRSHVPTSWLFGDNTGLQVRDFETGAFAWVGQMDPGGVTLYACDQIPTPENGWSGQNYMGWCNPDASDAIYAANNTLLQAERIAQYAIVQEQFAQDMVSLPLFSRLGSYAKKPALLGFQPGPGGDYYSHLAENWQIPGQDTLVWGLSQTPPSLFFPKENAAVSNLLYRMINPAAVYARNYSYFPHLLTEVPTPENGLVVLNVVTVTTGDKVYDINGQLVSLVDGVIVKDKDGNPVVFSGSPIQMLQMVVTYPFKPNIRWSDGQMLTKADFELGYSTACNPEAGMPSYYTCYHVHSIAFADDSSGYTITWVPGWLSPMYPIALFPWYPAHQVITSGGPFQGMTLAEVPASEWDSLPEITRSPLGVGPYQVTDWVDGDHITFQRNPYYVNGVPLTQTVIARFFSPDDLIIQMSAGVIDLVGTESASCPYDTGGHMVCEIFPSDTWEHLDFNLETFSVEADISTTQDTVLTYVDVNGQTTTVTMPSEAVSSDDYSLRLSPIVESMYGTPEDLVSAGIAYRLTAIDNGVPVEGPFTFNVPITFEITYIPQNISDKLFSIDLYLYDTGTAGWINAYLTCPESERLQHYNPLTQTLTVNVCHLSEFGVFGPPPDRIYLPMVFRK